MKLNRNDFGRKWQFPLMLACGSTPIGVVMTVNLAPWALPLAWLYPAVYALMALVCLLIPGKKRIIAGIVFALGMLGLGALLPLWKSVALALIPIAYAVLLLFTLPMGGWPREREPGFGWGLAGVLMHCIMQFMVNAFRRFEVSPYAAAEVPLLVTFLVFLLLAMLSLTRSSMESATMGRQGMPAGMKRRNRLLTLGLLVLVILISVMPAVINAINAAWDWMVDLIYRIIVAISRWLIPEEIMPEDKPQQQEMDFSGLGGATERSELAELLEKIFYGIAIVALVVLAVVLARFLYKKLKVLLRFLWEQLNRYAAAASSDDYEDEITDTREDGDKERVNVFSRLRQRMLRVDEKSLTPRERIRYRYLRQWLKHEDWSAGRTARENLPPDAAALYEQARYSEHPVSEEEANRFADMVKHV